MDTAFNNYLQKTGEYGVVVSVNHPIVFIEGLPHVKTHEVVLFETGQKGEVFTIMRGKIEVRSFSHEPVRVGTKVTRTDETVKVPVGPELLGHTITPTGELLDPSVPFTRPKESRELDASPGGISTRQKLTESLTTGSALIDLLIPLGMGQRELIIGDRKTGKTSLLLTTIKNQARFGMITVYAAIAKKKSDIKKLQEFFVQEKVMDNVIIVATSSYDSPSLIYQTPYAAMTIAEYFKEQGKHTLVVLDDLSTHARFYRELSLLARRFPGRDSYPGDIFYIHSKLLERSGCFKHPKVEKGVTVTCLPVIEIVEGDLTAYVSTNVMGITDGHIYFDANIYYEGRRPAVNIPLSVTRVGRQTLTKLNREINKELTAFLSSYDKMLNLSHFGQELTDDVKAALKRGNTIYDFFTQPYQLTIPINVQLTILSLIFSDVITEKKIMEEVRVKLTELYDKPEIKKQIDELTKTSDAKVFNENVLKIKDQILAWCGIHLAPPAPKPAAPANPATAPKPIDGQAPQTPKDGTAQQTPQQPAAPQQPQIAAPPAQPAQTPAQPPTAPAS